jgi:hypothetical protein
MQIFHIYYSFPTNQTKLPPNETSAKYCEARAQSCRCEVCAVRGGRCAAGWLPVRAARCTVRGLFAMQCAALYGMRCVGRCGALHGARIVCDAMRCARAGCIRAVRCAARDVMQCAAMHGMRCNALRAGWLHSRGAGGAMLLTMVFSVGFFWDGLNVHTYVQLRVKEDSIKPEALITGQTEEGGGTSHGVRRLQGGSG